METIIVTNEGPPNSLPLPNPSSYGLLEGSNWRLKLAIDLLLDYLMSLEEGEETEVKGNAN